MAGGPEPQERNAAPTLGTSYMLSFQIPTAAMVTCYYYQLGVVGTWAPVTLRPGRGPRQATSPRRHRHTLCYNKNKIKKSFNISHPLPPSLPQAGSTQCDSHRGQGFSGPGGTEGGVPIHGAHKVPHEVGEALLHNAGAHSAHQPQLQWGGGVSNQPPAWGRPPSPLPHPSQLQAHLIGDVVDSEVVQGRGVVAMEQCVQEGPAVPGDGRRGLSSAGSFPPPCPPPAPRLRPPLLLAGGTGTLWVYGAEVFLILFLLQLQVPRGHQGRAKALGVDRGRGRWVNQVFPPPWPPQSPSGLSPAEGLTAVRVGKTQSNMSHPRATQTTRSVA